MSRGIQSRIQETCAKLLAQAEKKRRDAIAAAEAEYQQTVTIARLLGSLNGSAATRLEHGKLSAVVLSAVEQLNGPFTVRDIATQLHDFAPELAERISIASISTTLRRLAVRGRLGIAEAGNATRASKYRKLEEGLKQEGEKGGATPLAGGATPVNLMA